MRKATIKSVTTHGEKLASTARGISPLSVVWPGLGSGVVASVPDNQSVYHPYVSVSCKNPIYDSGYSIVMLSMRYQPNGVKHCVCKNKRRVLPFPGYLNFISAPSPLEAQSGVSDR